MAPRVKAGVAAAVAAVVALTVWLVPPDPPEVRARGTLDTVSNRAARLKRDLRRLEEVLARVAIRDTVEALVGRSPGALVVDLPAEVPDSVAAAYRSLIGARVDSLGMARGEVTLVRAILPVDYGREEGRAWSAEGGRAWLVLDGSVDGEPYCAVVRRSGRPGSTAAARVRSGRDAEADREPFHFCRFHARYGPPGSRIGRWLVERGGFALATTSPGELEPEGLFPWSMPFIRNALVGTGDPGEARCLAGDREACARTVLLPTRSLRSRRSSAPDPLRASGFEATFLRWRGYALGYGGYASTYLADLERAFGEERFRRFWSSDLPLSDAFESAFGEDPGAYTHRWATARLGTLRAGPVPVSASVAIGLLLLALLTGVSVRVGVRRTVV